MGKTKEELKEIFKSGSKPTGEDFSELIDSIAEPKDGETIKRAIITKDHTGEVELFQIQMTDDSVIEVDILQRPAPVEDKEEEE